MKTCSTAEPTKNSSPEIVMRTLASFIVVCFFAGAVGCTEFATPRDDPPGPQINSQPLTSAESSEVCLKAGKQLDDGGYTQDAIIQYERAREYDSSADVNWRLAVLYDRLGMDKKALAEYQRALDVHPESADVLNDIGYFHLTRGNASKGEDFFRRGLVKAPRSHRLWVNLGLAFGEQGRYNEAMEAFKKALPDAQAMSNLAIVAARRGDRDKAVELLKKALAQDPDLPQARAALAWLEGKA
jgi:Tfp pilus assembly protein PilF